MNEQLLKVIELTARQHIKDALNVYGIEGAEQKIKEVYGRSPKVEKYMLNLFRKMLRGE